MKRNEENEEKENFDIIFSPNEVSLRGSQRKDLALDDNEEGRAYIHFLSLSFSSQPNRFYIVLVVLQLRKVVEKVRSLLCTRTVT